MKLFDFDYEKKDGSKSQRSVMSLHAADKYVDGIDLTKLSDEEINELKSIQLEYERKLKPFTRKAFRRFLKEGMTITHEETIKE